MLKEEEAKAIQTQYKGPGMDPRMLAAILNAYRAYKGKDIPTDITFVKLFDQITGLDCTRDDVSILPWDEDMHEQKDMHFIDVDDHSG